MMPNGGALAALDAIEAATGEQRVNAIGYCLGGTLLASTAAYLAAKGSDRIASATYFVTLVDFTEVGDMAVFIDEEQLASLERRMHERGYLEAQDMSTSFNMLRANDLIWSFVVNNYLLGKEQLPFDLLFWNSDSTRMPAAMHSFYLRNMYQQNLLAKPGGISLADTPIDLSKITAPSFVLAKRRPHRAMEIRLCGDALVFRTDQVCLVSFGPYGWRDQRPRQQIRALGERQSATQSRRMVRWRDRPPRILVASLGQMDNATRQRTCCCPRTRARQVADYRRCSGLLRSG
jgi:pimeloyl-ACP methyl ester carboxylesterase